MKDKIARVNDKLDTEIHAFRESITTLHLGTVDKDNHPHTSYAPFAFSDNGYYILVSDLAQHGQNLKVCNEVSIMMIEDEKEARSIFARRRLSFSARAELISHDSEHWHMVMKVMENRLGKMISQLGQLSDFKLYCLIPVNGRYVKGFGQAFEIAAEDLKNA